ncbi:MAG: DUF2161 family putative PD-(D/E)XK-type phosphodiesterase [Candidatus Cloacimonetes bacterium]|nr:DUF2161 family putative PD-(D/E)XK-type phosphodiesterase [Candidatus Cloacimonadota bacterium]
MKESDLFKPVQNLLESNNFTVNAEVRSCDIVAIGNDSGDMLIVELKTSFNLKLILQAIDRQKISNSVYIALPYSAMQGKSGKNYIHLIKRLELGLILVNLLEKNPFAEVVFHPLPITVRKNNKRKLLIIKEASKRIGNRNIGGINRTKIITAYRQDAVEIAFLLKLRGNSTPAELVKLGAPAKTGKILYSNFYKWFQRIEKGVYNVTNKGIEESASYSSLIDVFCKKYSNLS